ncbi:TIGR04104 family putative zinc finger protein [Jeotgalibacillus aurantiacus]|uniref:TIGR04104 family putative zinc finger protein n=1 Tax=Jeotgalibacillus aurantiacus TaxID=2763266 RepID=UPI001D09CD3A|nr:TIGR04104 family putative zinc finger protein [Jeotgalibacillus aurantiacus]
MPTCNTCGKRWTFTQSIKKALLYSKGTKCFYCGTPQYLSTRSGKRTNLIYVIALLGVVLGRPLFDLAGFPYLMLAIPVIIIVMVIVPFSIELSNEKEPLW